MNDKYFYECNINEKKYLDGYYNHAEYITLVEETNKKYNRHDYPSNCYRYAVDKIVNDKQ